MKRMFLGLCMAVVLGSTAAVLAGDQDFELVNQTGLTIDQVYVSQANDNEWGEDVLGRDVLKNTEAVDISFSRNETECLWDLKIVDADADEVEWTDINLCKAAHVTLSYKNKQATAEIR